MEIVKIKLGKKLLLSIAILGPGHSPPIPQPIPNIADPPISLKSIFLYIGR